MFHKIACPVVIYRVPNMPQKGEERHPDNQASDESELQQNTGLRPSNRIVNTGFCTPGPPVYNQANGTID